MSTYQGYTEPEDVIAARKARILQKAAPKAVKANRWQAFVADVREFGPETARLFGLILLIDIPVSFVVMSVMRAILR